MTVFVPVDAAGEPHRDGTATATVAVAVPLVTLPGFGPAGGWTLTATPPRAARPLQEPGAVSAPGVGGGPQRIAGPCAGPGPCAPRHAQPVTTAQSAGIEAAASPDRAAVAELHQRGRAVLGLFDPDDPHGRDDLLTTGVDEVLPRDAPPRGLRRGAAHARLILGDAIAGPDDRSEITLRDLGRFLLTPSD